MTCVSVDDSIATVLDDGVHLKPSFFCSRFILYVNPFLQKECSFLNIISRLLAYIYCADILSYNIIRGCKNK